MLPITGKSEGIGARPFPQCFKPPRFGDAGRQLVSKPEGADHPAPPAPTPPMGKFIDAAKYHLAERCHAGWELANALMRHFLLKRRPIDECETVNENPGVLEIGCASGTSTLPFVEYLIRQDAQYPNERSSREDAFRSYNAVDIDDSAIGVLESELGKKRQEVPMWADSQALKEKRQRSLAKVRAISDDAMRFVDDESTGLTHGVMQFSLSHFDAAGKSYLLDRLVQRLKLTHTFGNVEPYSWAEKKRALDNGWTFESGEILITDEFLPRYTDDATEKEALWRHHGAVIFDALIKGNFDLAELELEALYSGIHRIGDFKISCEEFEDMLWEKNLQFRKYKTFPLKPDLIPFDPSRPKKGKRYTEREIAANQLWQAQARSIFEAMVALAPVQNCGVEGLENEGLENLRLPDGPRRMLHALGEKFHRSGFSSLRKTPVEADFDPLPDRAEAYEVYGEQRSDQSHGGRLYRIYNYEFYEKKGSPSGRTNRRIKPTKANLQEHWGVYTYRICKDTAIAWKKKKQIELSDALADTSDLSDAVEKLKKLPETLLPNRELVARDYDNLYKIMLSIPANRWCFAMGDRRPSYQELQNPATAKTWRRKVDFMKAAIFMLFEETGLTREGSNFWERWMWEGNPMSRESLERIVRRAQQAECFL